MKKQELIEIPYSPILSAGEANAQIPPSIGQTIINGWQSYCHKISTTRILSEAKGLDNKELANFIESPQEIQGRYQESGLLIRGGGKFLCVKGSDKAEGRLSKSYVMPLLVKSERPGIPAETLVVLKVIPFSANTPIGYAHVNETAPYAKLSLLEGICGFYPKIYGAYYGPPIKNLTYTNLLMNSGNKPFGFLYMEMELAHKNLYPCYGTGEALVPDSIIFEISLGQWATSTIAKLEIGDDKARHHVLKDVDYSRAYHIGKHTYLFSHSELPKRIDLDVSQDAKGDPEISKMNAGLRILHDEKVQLSEEARAFLDELDDDEIEQTTLNLLYKYFSKYIMQDVDLPCDQKIEHFHIPAEFIEEGYSHESAAVTGSAHQAVDSLD